MINLYIWRKCGICLNAIRFLKELGLSVNERDFFDAPFSREEIQGIAFRISIKDMFSWRSPSARPYRDRKFAISDNEMVSLMLQEPRLIRRPILVAPTGEVILGFDKKRYSLLCE